MSIEAFFEALLPLHSASDNDIERTLGELLLEYKKVGDALAAVKKETHDWEHKKWVQKEWSRLMQRAWRIEAALVPGDLHEATREAHELNQTKFELTAKYQWLGKTVSILGHVLLARRARQVHMADIAPLEASLFKEPADGWGPGAEG